MSIYASEWRAVEFQFDRKGNVIHLDEFVLDLLQTSLPAVPLCKENCRGLCHTCGVNLNEEIINCRMKKDSGVNCGNVVDFNSKC